MAAPKAGKNKDWFQSMVSESVGPLVLMTCVPFLGLATVHFSVVCKSRLDEVLVGGISSYLRRVISDADFADPLSWSAVIISAIWSAVVPVFIGGKTLLGPPTATGYRAEYVDSAFTYYVLTTSVVICALVSGPIGWLFYSRLFPFTCATSLFGWVCTVALYAKGHFRPSPGEHGSTGNFIFDFYWGRELYPRVGRHLDLKMWAVLFYGVQWSSCVMLVCWKAQCERIGWNWAMASSSLLFTFYMFRVFWGYYEYVHSIDQMHDRTGFYLVWGSIGWVPSLLSCGGIYMVENPSDLGPLGCLVLVIFGVTAVGLSYWSDNQRVGVRAADGHCLVWGRPARLVRTCYLDGSGKTRKGLLLASGFWGLSRHPNYILELASYLSWALMTKSTCLIPYLSFSMLLILVVHRTTRDDRRCRQKYGSAWEEYCSLVPYKLLPGIF